MNRRAITVRKRRPRRVLLRALRRSFPHLGRFAPLLASWIAELLFRTPPRQRRLKWEEGVLGRGRFSRTRFGERFLPTWKWGKGPTILLVHGWGGHAGRLARFVEPLTRAGFSVVAFDAPGHGAAGGRRSALPEFVRAIRAVSRAHGPFEGIIGHSLGAAACALAIRDGLRASRAVLLAPPDDLERYPSRFARFYRMPAETRDAMKERLASRYRIRWTELKVSGGDCRARVLVVHDRRDVRVPLADGVEIARTWRNAELVRTRGLGHHRILRDRRVIARAVGFLAGRRAARFVPVRRRPVALLSPAPS